ncbi:MAG: HlyD family efflux transporter periplasmic adaptor subunit [Algicola sp.]|nr:HlyD family efflux transporter periplasmic adaptor subunit [Algicola sp.]
MKTVGLSITLAVLLLTVAAQTSAAQASASKKTEKPVVVQQALQSPYVKQYRGIGFVQSQYVIGYSAQSEGVILQLKTEGEVYLAGSVVVQLDDTMNQLAYQKSRHQEQQLGAELDSQQLKLDNINGLLKSKSVAPQQVELRQLALQQAGSLLNVQRSESQLQKALINTMQVKAVRPGVVLQRHQNIGEFVAKGTLLLTTIDMTALKIKVALPLKFYQDFNLQAKIQLTLGGKQIDLNIAATLPSGRNHFEVISELFDGSKIRLTHDAKVDVTVVMPAEQMLQWFHQDALISMKNSQTGMTVVLANGHYERRRVTILSRVGDFVGGHFALTNNEKIVLRGMDNLAEQQVLTVATDLTANMVKKFAAVQSRNAGVRH